MKNIFANEVFNKFANTCLDNELSIIVPEDTDRWNYLTFTDGKNFGYAQLDEFKDRIRFTTVHKPNRFCGTGYGLQDSYEGIINPTIKDIKEAFIFAPVWAKSSDKKHVVKYTSLDDYLSNHMHSGKEVIYPKTK